MKIHFDNSNDVIWLAKKIKRLYDKTEWICPPINKVA